MLERSVLTGLDAPHLALETPLGRELEVDVERRVDLEALLVELFAELRVELLAHPLDEIRRSLAGDRFVGELQRIGLRSAGVGFADDAVLPHQTDDALIGVWARVGQKAMPLQRLVETGGETVVRTDEVSVNSDVDALGQFRHLGQALGCLEQHVHSLERGDLAKEPEGPDSPLPARARHRVPPTP